MDRVAVLVVDDSDGICAAVSTLLEDAGFEVRTASNYKQTIQLASESDFHVFLIDARLGPDSGLDLARELLSRRPRAKIIIMSGADFDGEEMKSQGQRLKLPVLQKPFSRQELLDCVRRVADKAA